MVKVVGSRDSGKTRRLLEECGKVNGIFVCKHPERIEEKCAAYGLPLVNAIGYGNGIRLREEDMNKPFFIDELDEFISTCLPVFGGYSLTVDEDE